MVQELRFKALAQFLNCDEDDLTESVYDERVIEYGRDSYYVLEDYEADEACEEYLRESLWAFNSSFLANYTDLPDEVFKALCGKYESGNDAILTIVERTEGGLKGLVEEAIAADGRGHFLSPYDGEEIEVYLEEENQYVFIYQL